MIFRQHPSYKERLLTSDKKTPLSALDQVWTFFLFLLFHFTSLILSIYLRIRYFRLFSNIDENFLRYKSAFGFWSVTGNIHKAQECIFFRAVHLRDPSLEIGICRGDISWLHFEGKKFTCGSEYIYFTAARAHRDYDLWQWVISDDLNNMAWKDESFSSICLVHTIDQVKDLDTVMKELYRVLKDQGEIYFSGYTNYFFKPNIVHFLLRLFSQTLADRFAKVITSRRCHYNLYSKEQWAEILRDNSFEMVEFRFFEGEGYAWVKYSLHHYLATGRCFEFNWFGKFKKLRFIEDLFHFYYTSIGYPAYCLVRDNRLKWGADFFLKARKKKR